MTRDWREFEMAGWSAEVKARQATDPDISEFWTTVAEGMALAAKVTRDASVSKDAVAETPEAEAPVEAGQAVCPSPLAS